MSEIAQCDFCDAQRAVEGFSASGNVPEGWAMLELTASSSEPGLELELCERCSELVRKTLTDLQREGAS